MRRALRFGVPLAAVAAATIAGGLLFATQPWQGEEAAGTTTAYRLCNVSIDVPPQPDLFEITPVFETLDLAEKSLALRVALKEPREMTDPKTGALERKRSGVTIDPENGDVIFERYLTPFDEDLLKSVLTTLRVQPIDPATAPWPYRGATTARIETVKDGNVEYRLPDPGAGFIVTPVYSLSADAVAVDVSFILVRNCRSQLWVGMQSGSILRERTIIHPADEAAFQRFLGEVNVRAAQQ